VEDLGWPHYIEIEIGRDLKKPQGMIKHSTALPDVDNSCREFIRTAAQLQDEQS
jgi:hypothetical protein